MMSLFKFFKNLFSKENDFPKASELASYQPFTDENLNKWRKAQSAKARELEVKVKSKIVALINANDNHLKFSWDSGNDEAFLYFESKEEIFEEEELWELEEYMIVKLDIPDAGEFEMHGEGFLKIENSSAIADFWSTLKVMEDYDEENDQEIWSEIETEKKEEQLFQV
ncbi:hypothetical protein [Chryseobacterium sp.]|uniref:hypothetical protein n=1 Tax=Chryseobacterium sp. TaxID=1871047 RepID=UPI002899A802|nr:hypothetical protein [Chryseobacterium sp.]